ncbi:MAG: hypothetical protein H7A23_10810 [Leptospiraceae bacterium]|nr:hypothetical protein [Leptospiraceae bacterium]MCP5495035.1 hypothetical protein [Leptospiraceae bacterium]
MDLFNPTELDLIDLNQEFHVSLGLEKFIIGRFNETEIYNMMDEAGMFKKLTERGYPKVTLEIMPLSELDNRIYIKDKKGETLVHIRLKLNDFYLKQIKEVLKMVYIDWLLTQNIKMGKLKGKKALFVGQEYPGLNVFLEIQKFIYKLMVIIGAHGVFNVPEYFHDAVLFHKNFRFVDPEKEGNFRAVIKSFTKVSLRTISECIHSGKVKNSVTGEVYKWKNGEMLYTHDDYLNDKIFNEEYFSNVSKIKESSTFEIIP